MNHLLNAKNARIRRATARQRPEIIAANSAAMLRQVRGIAIADTETASKGWRKGQSDRRTKILAPADDHAFVMAC